MEPPPIAPPPPAPAPDAPAPAAPAIAILADPFTPPSLGGGGGVVDESQLPNGTNAVISPDVTLVTGVLDVDFGDAPAILTFSSVESGNSVSWSPGQTVSVAGAHGLLTINPDGSWVYDVDVNVFHPNAGFTGTDDSLPDDFTLTLDFTDADGNPQTFTSSLISWYSMTGRY